MENKKYVPKSARKYHEKKRSLNLNGLEGNADLPAMPVKEKTSSPLTVEVTTQKVNKLIIKNDTEDEEELRKEVERSTTTAIPSSSRNKRIHVSPIKFDIKNDDHGKRAKSSDFDENNFKNHTSSNNRNSSKDRSGDESQRVTTKRTEVSRKYENLPPRK